MLTYRAPDADWKLLVQSLAPEFAPHASPEDRDLWCQVIDAAGKFHAEVFAPCAGSGDRQGARLVDGHVITPDGYQRAWSAYVDAGWLGASLPESAGGWGLPKFLHVMLSEMRAACAHSLAMYGSFCAPAAHMLLTLGKPWMKVHIVPRLASGQWTASMCLTEAHCGSDLRQIRTQAWQDEQGQWRISGEKIFISGGDQDLTENIVHIVLAKVVAEPPYHADHLENLRVFAVPKIIINSETGALETKNTVDVLSIESKMGIEGSATCVMKFDSAQAWLIDAPAIDGKSAGGMAPMFTMMNYARAGTAISSIGHAHMAYQNAVVYAQQRISGRDKNKRSVAILEHKDIQRLLLGARSFVEGGRAALMLFSMWHEDGEKFHTSRHAENKKLHELLTPVVKAFFTDEGFEAANACLQVYGGHGYIKDYGIEQIVRNARIGQIYEGTNGIQAIDFLQRKLIADDWCGFEIFSNRVKSLFSTPASQEQKECQIGMEKCISVLNSIHLNLGNIKDQDKILFIAYDVLQAVGITLIAYSWMSLLFSMKDQRAQQSPEFIIKKKLAQHWFNSKVNMLPALESRIKMAEISFFEFEMGDF